MTHTSRAHFKHTASSLASGSFNCAYKQYTLYRHIFFFTSFSSMFAYHIIKVMSVLCRKNNHHANIQNEKPTKNTCPTIPLPKGSPVNSPPSFGTLCSPLCSLAGDSTSGHGAPRFPLWLSSVFTLSRMRSVPIIGIDSTASPIPGSCSLIYTFTLLQPEALLTLISCNDFNKAFL